MNNVNRRSMSPMDKLKAMQAFIHIAEQGSLTAAAQVMESVAAGHGAHAGRL
jgi:hypothetical protein